MIWLWIYLASILPAMLVSAYMCGRERVPSCISGQVAIVSGAFWPIMLPMLVLVVLVERVEELGRAEFDKQSNEIK